jgi:hypothetical protein
LCVVAGSCDPCTGTADCRRSPVVAVIGQIVDETSGMPVGDVQVAIARQSGVALQPSNGTTTSSANGMFELELAASDEGEVVVTVTVAAPGRRPYTVPDLRVAATTRTGTATVLHPWVAANPIFPYVVILHREGTQEGIANATVEFRPTAGPAILSSDTAVSIVRGTTDGSGWSYLFRGLTADQTGVITGDLTIRTDSGTSLTLPQVTWSAAPRFHHETIVVVVAVPSP